MSELRDLYQDVILDHGKNPRNKREIPEANEARGHNPLCGDQITVYLRMDGDVVEDVSFEGSGCAISTAAASMMTQALKGKTREEVEALFHAYHDVVTGKISLEDAADLLGKLAVFAGVSEFPVRVKCATLAWHTMHAALEESGKTVTTE
jgi:nitrogen fixation NifU-like protein